MEGAAVPPTPTDPVVAIYREALPRVYGYLLPRSGSASLAEDLASETFLAAVRASHQGSLPEVNVAWLVAVARHKLVDHWRRLEREQRSLAAADAPDSDVDDPWDEWLDTEAAYSALAPLPDGTVRSPGGWNRILIQVADLDATIDALNEAGVRFLDDRPTGVAVRQVLLEDPSGNPIELFEPATGYHERARCLSNLPCSETSQVRR
jgi:catechol 2,3-dioxygenase-like lactoylglutathione lyase family enzyme